MHKHRFSAQFFALKKAGINSEGFSMINANHDAF